MISIRKQIDTTMPKTKQELANLMGISISTLKRWIRNQHIETDRGLLSPVKQVEILCKCGYFNSKSQVEL
jgi:DNA invertase Pin-like site-specific DNA recombinase